MNWSETAAVGTRYEYGQIAAGNFKTRFQLWCESFGLPTKLEPLRPHYQETSENTAWATEQWSRSDIKQGGNKRVLVFPTCTRNPRKWPRAYNVDLIAELKSKGYAVAAMAGQKEEIDYINCFHMWGYQLDKVAAMINQADLIIGCDTGTIHLSATINKTAAVICGPTDAKIVYGHYQNVFPVFLNENKPDCFPCHFDPKKGYREACEFECQVLLRFTPDMLIQQLKHLNLID